MAVSNVVENIFNTILEQLADEIGALLGAPVEFSEHRLAVLSKEQLLEINRGRSVLSSLVISGDGNGEAFIITDLKDSVVLGGTLIMLPRDQIEENCKLRNFEGEASDAFGEVANIIAGIYTAVFLDLYPKNLHFKRTTVANFIPAQISPDSTTPFASREYVHSCCSIKMEGFELHNLEVIVPAELLGEGTLADESSTVQPVAPAAAGSDSATLQTPPAAAAASPASPAPETPPNAVQEEVAEPEPVTSGLVKQETVDKVLKAALVQCAEEVGGMLGLEIELTDLSARYISKQEFFAKPGKKAIATEMLVSGDSEGTAYFLTELKDAIYFAGTMIMLPAAEIDKHIKAGEYGEDEADAFSEVANIVSGGLVQNFSEMYPRKFHLKKGEQRTYTPTKVTIDDPLPFPDGEYYLVSGTMNCEARDLGDMVFLCPVDVLHMVPRPAASGWGAAEPNQPAAAPAAAKSAATGNKNAAPVSGSTPAAKATAAAAAPTPSGAAATPPVIVIISDDPNLGHFFAESLQESQHQTLTLKTSDNFNQLRQQTILGAFLVMSSVNEQGFASIIKIRSEIPQGQPLIVGGSRWTRSDVIKAVRYGATDIIVTPATAQEICEKARTNLKTTCH